MSARGERFEQLGASPKEVAEADFIVATAELKKWDQYSPDEGANQNARRSAQRAMDDYYDANKNKDAAAAVRGAGGLLVGQDAQGRASSATPTSGGRRRSPRSRRGAGSRRHKDGKSSALGSPEAGMAAEAEFTMLDEEITQKFDYEIGPPPLQGHAGRGGQRSTRQDAVDAKQYYDKLQHVVDAYVSPEWATAAVARQGSLYDSLRTGLYNARPPDAEDVRRQDRKRC